ncbi:MAG: PIG-L deacetylase family protein [Planctomycetaceae bacterium]
MRVDFSGERLLAVVAHPDDAELLCAGTLARASSDGARIGIAVLCQGDRGQPGVPIANLADVRRDEMRAAARVLSADLLTGEFGDGTLQDDPPSRQRVVELMRQFRPTLILGHAPNDYHADHRAASALVDACSWIASSRGLITDSPPLDQPAAVWWLDTVAMHGFDPGFFVDVTEFVSVKEEMLRCHASQLQRGTADGFVPLLEEMRMQSSTRGRQAGVVAAEAFRLHTAFGRVRAW